MKAKVAVFVSGGGTNLQAIIDAAQRGEIPSAEIALVASNKSDAYALEKKRVKPSIPARFHPRCFQS